MEKFKKFSNLVTEHYIMQDVCKYKNNHYSLKLSSWFHKITTDNEILLQEDEDNVRSLDCIAEIDVI